MRYKNNKITTNGLKSVSNSFFPKADGEGDYYMLYLNYFCLLKCNLLKKQVDVHIKSNKKCIEKIHGGIVLSKQHIFNGEHGQN